MTSPSPGPDVFHRIWTACLLLLGSVVLLNLAICYLKPVLPWLLCGLGLAAVVWVSVLVIRWRQSRW